MLVLLGTLTPGFTLCAAGVESVHASSWSLPVTGRSIVSKAMLTCCLESEINAFNFPVRDYSHISWIEDYGIRLPPFVDVAKIPLALLVPQYQEAEPVTAWGYCIKLVVVLIPDRVDDVVF
jgi:hypothetical protein